VVLLNYSFAPVRAVLSKRKKMLAASLVHS
jgi:hypothetical protein